MFCNKCGKELPDGTKFCSGCGAQLKVPATAPTVPAATSTPQVGVSASVPGSVGGASFAGSADFKRLTVIGAALLTVAALIFMFLPWISYSYKNGGYDFPVASVSVLDVSKQKDTIVSGVKASVVASNSLAAMSGSGQSSADLNESMRGVQGFETLLSALIGLWFVGLGLGIAGLVSIVSGKLRYGFSMLLGPAASSVGWLILAGIADSMGSGFSASLWLIACLVCSIVAFLLYMASNREPLIKK